MQLNLEFYVNCSICAQRLPKIHATMFERSKLRGGQLTTTLKKGAIHGCQHDKPVGRSPRHPAPWDSSSKTSLAIVNSQEFERWGTPHHLPRGPHCENKREVKHGDRERCCEEDRKRGGGIMPGSEDSFWGRILEKRCLAECAGSSPAGLELRQPSWQGLLWCSKRERGLLYKVHQSAGTLHFLFPTVALMRLLFFFRTVYLWSEIYCSVHEQSKHPHNLEQKSWLPVVIFTIRMRILRRVIKASDGVCCPPPTRTESSFPFLPVLANIFGMWKINFGFSHFQ